MHTTPSKTPTLIAYGGSFDPPHAGHTASVCAALARLPEARVCVLPAAHPARSAGQAKAVAASFAHRLAMAQLAFAELGPRVTIASWERELPSPNYTLQTLTHLAALAPTERLGFLLGQDQWAAFGRWHEPRAVLAAADILVLRREGASQQSLRALTDELATQLGLSFAWNAAGDEASCAATGRSIFLLDQAVSNAASTQLRRELSSAPLTAPMDLAPSVLAYIKQHHLYQEH